MTTKVVVFDMTELWRWRATKNNPNATMDDYIEAARGPQSTVEEWTEFLADQHPDESEAWAKEQAEEGLGYMRDSDLYARAYASLPSAPDKNDPMYDAWKGRLHEALRDELKRQKARDSLNGNVRFTHLDQFLQEQEETTEWFISDLVPQDTLFQFLGKPESFKSMALVGIHVATSHGGLWLGREVQPMHSYYVSGEKRRRSIRERLQRLTDAEPVPQMKDLVIVHRTGLTIDPDNELWKRLVDDVASRHERTMVSLDTVTTLAPAGFNENSGESWAVVLNAMRMLTDLPEPATVLASFHPAKADKGGVGMSSRGHGSFDGEADGAVVFNRPSRTTDMGSIHARPKDGRYTVIPFFWDHETFRLVPKDLTAMPLNHTTMVDVVLAHGPCEFEDIWNAYGNDEVGKHRFGKEKVREVLNAAVDAGAVATERANANEKTKYFIPAEEEA